MKMEVLFKINSHSNTTTSERKKFEQHQARKDKRDFNDYWSQIFGFRCIFVNKNCEKNYDYDYSIEKTMD